METKYHAFLDESGQREYDPKTERYYVVAGAISPLDKVEIYNIELGGLKRAFFKTPEVEIKSHWLRQPEKRAEHYLEQYGISDKKLTAFVEAVYEWIIATDIMFIAGIIDKVQIVEQYRNPHNCSALGYQVFLQRYQKFLASRHCLGGVTFDQISGSTKAGNQWQKLLERQHRRLKEHGCEYTGIQFPNIEEELSFEDSANSALLQIADLTAYNTFRQFRDHGTQWDDPKAKTLPVYDYFNRLLPRFHQSPSGVFAGFGVAKMPTRTIHKWLV